MSAVWPMMAPPTGDGELCVVKAKGHQISYIDGTSVLCGTSGLWNANLGYGNEAIASAVYRAMLETSYAGTFRMENVWARRAAERLIAASAHKFGRVIFSVSGGTANDLAMKLSRQFHELGGKPGRKYIVGLTGSYHGLTFGAHALTGEELNQRGYGIDTRLIRHVEPNDPDTLRTLASTLGHQVAAIVIEPVLGSGAIALSREFISSVGEFADSTGALVVSDEVATGFGRTGTMFASDEWERPPDILITSKGLTNGTMAASALLVSREIVRRFESSHSPVFHGETQAGTAVSAAAIEATLDEFDRLDAVRAGQLVGKELDAALQKWSTSKNSPVLQVQGIGCFRGVTLVNDNDEPVPQSDVPALVSCIRARGATVHGGINGVQFVPALTYSASEVRELVLAAQAGVGDYLSGSRGGAA